MEFKGAIFDLDGTLLDSMKVWGQVDKEFFESRNIEMPADYPKVVAPMGAQRCAEYTKDRFNLPDSIESILDEWAKAGYYHYENNVEMKDGAKEYLLYLKEKGVKLAIATASEEALFGVCLKKYGIYNLFDNITTISEVNRGKGFPDIYEKAAEKMGLTAEDCVVFEDIYLGIKGAIDGNFRTVCMRDEFSVCDEKIIKEICDKYIVSFKEMMNKTSSM